MGYFEIIEVQYFLASTDSIRLVRNFRMIEMDVSVLNMISVFWSKWATKMSKTLGNISLNKEDIKWMMNIE